jgi:hypothetical protein
MILACRVLRSSVGPGKLQVTACGRDFRHPQRREAYRSLTEHAARGEISIDVIQLPLAEVASAWEQQRQGAPAKLVLVP